MIVFSRVIAREILMERNTRLILFVAAVLCAPALAIAQSASPNWEDSQFTKFRRMDCPVVAPDLILRRSTLADQSGPADVLGFNGSDTTQGSWTLSGTTLKVFASTLTVMGVWSGNRFTAQVSAPALNVTCTYRVSGTAG
jgi:hypothetical protein